MENTCETYTNNIPFGTINRKPASYDLPGNSFIACQSGSKGIMLYTKCTYGFKGNHNSLGLTLLRNSYNPHPCPEIGVHHLSFIVNVVSDYNPSSLSDYTMIFDNPLLTSSGTRHEGQQGLTGSFMKVQGDNISISTIKTPEGDVSNKAIIIRLSELEGLSQQVTLTFNQPIFKAEMVDLTEEVVSQGSDIKVSGTDLSYGTIPYCIQTIKVTFM